MSKTIVRPEKFTRFLSHMFPTERDRLSFEMITYWMGIDTKYGCPKAKNIELVMPTHDYLLKCDSLMQLGIINDGNTPKEIHEYRVLDICPIVVNMCNTAKTKKQQLNFITRLYGSTQKIYRAKKEREDNVNTYIFAVRESLCQGNSYFKTYSLSDYNDEDYKFTEDEKKEYNEYLEKIVKVLEDIYVKSKKHQLDEVLDIYYNEFDKTEQK